VLLLPPARRLTLPSALEPGPVASHLLSTQEGQQGVVLGSATTMALPPAAAAELLRAYSIDIPGSTATQAEYQEALRDLLRDYALCWQLYSGKQQAEPYPEQLALPEAGTTGPAGDQSLAPALEQALSDLLQHLSDNSMPACHCLLSAHTTTSPSPASNPAAAAAAEVLTAAAASVSSFQGQVALSSLQRGPVTLVQRCAAHVSLMKAMSHDPRYTAWRMQQRRWVDMHGWRVPATMYVAGTALMLKRRLNDVGFRIPSALSMVLLFLHSFTGVGPQVLLAVGGERMRARREAAVVLFAVVKALVCIASVLCWLPTPADVRAVWGNLRAVVVIHGVCRPCQIQVKAEGCCLAMRAGRLTCDFLHTFGVCNILTYHNICTTSVLPLSPTVKQLMSSEFDCIVVKQLCWQI
jgi:hypothetical protein